MSGVSGASHAMLRPMSHRLVAHTPEQIALLEPFERLGLDRIVLVHTARQATEAAHELADAPAWGFDTESKPTFLQGEVSDGPHIVQLANLHKAWVFQLHDAQCRDTAAMLLARPGVVKAGFGLGDDRKRIERKLGVQPQDVLDLNHVFRERGWRKDMGVKAAVAALFGRRYQKSKKAATSNWSNLRLSESQLVYAANDAWAAIKVFHALELEPGTAPR